MHVLLNRKFYIHLQMRVSHGVILSTEKVVLAIYCTLSVRWLLLMLNFKIWKCVLSEENFYWNVVEW